MIRTEELLAARRIDGGRQYFTRAYRFRILEDARRDLAALAEGFDSQGRRGDRRAFRPQVIISVWSAERRPTDTDITSSRASSRARRSTPRPTRCDSRRSGWRVEAVGAVQVLSSAPRRRRDVARVRCRRVRAAAWRERTRRSRRRAGRSTGRRDRARCRSAGRLQRPCNSRYRACPMPRRPRRDCSTGWTRAWARFKSFVLADSVRTALDSLAGGAGGGRRVGESRGPVRMVAPLVDVCCGWRRVRREVCNCVTLDALRMCRRVTCDAAMGDLRAGARHDTERATQRLLDAAGVSDRSDGAARADRRAMTVPVTVARVQRGEDARSRSRACR